MSLNFGNSKVTQVKFGANTSSLSDVNKIIFNGSVAWCRPFTLTITKDSGVSSVTVTRTSTEEPTSTKNVTLSSGAEIYYNDVLSISASPKECYKLGTYDSSKTVSGNISVSITSSFQSPIAPTVSDVSTGGTPSNRWAKFTLKNNNPYTSILNYEVSGSSGSPSVTGGIGTLSSGSSSTQTIRITNGSYSIRVRAYSGCRNANNETVESAWSSYVSATYTAPTLSAPSLSVSGTTVTIKNNNSTFVTMYFLRPYSNTWATSTLAANASTTINCEQDLGMAGQTSGTFQAYFKCDGYTQSSTSSITVKKTQTTQDPLVYIKTFVPSITYSASSGITISNFNTLLSATGTTADYWDICILRFHKRNSRRINDAAGGCYRNSFGARKFRMDKNAGRRKANSSGLVTNTNSSYASDWVYSNCDDNLSGNARYNNCFGVRIMPSSKRPFEKCYSRYSDKMYYNTSGSYYTANEIIDSISREIGW